MRVCLPSCPGRGYFCERGLYPRCVPRICRLFFIRGGLGTLSLAFFTQVNATLLDRHHVYLCVRVKRLVFVGNLENVSLVDSHTVNNLTRKLVPREIYRQQEIRLRRCRACCASRRPGCQSRLALPNNQPPIEREVVAKPVGGADGSGPESWRGLEHVTRSARPCLFSLSAMYGHLVLLM